MPLVFVARTPTPNQRRRHSIVGPEPRGRVTLHLRSIAFKICKRCRWINSELETNYSFERHTLAWFRRLHGNAARWKIGVPGLSEYSGIEMNGACALCRSLKI